MFNMEIGNRNSIPVAVLTCGTCTTEMLSSEFFKIKLIKYLYENNGPYFCLIIHIYIRNIRRKQVIRTLFFLSKFTNVQSIPPPARLSYGIFKSKFWFGYCWNLDGGLSSWNKFPDLRLHHT